MTASARTMLALAMLLFIATSVNATMRCGRSLISEGDSIQSVREKCGAPDAQSNEGPALEVNGTPKRNAARITRWVYGPRNGAYQHLRFIDERLVSIHTQRQ